MALSISEIAELLAGPGLTQYGNEAVSQFDHALQCADLAEQAGESVATIVASLLHDLGHLLVRDQQSGSHAAERDDRHQYAALPFLRSRLPDAVLEPIRLHVDAKRHLCAVEPGYLATLSPGSVRSLALQGGAFTTAQAVAFAGRPYAGEAIRLRRYDDLAKVPRRETPTLAHFMRVVESAGTW